MDELLLEHLFSNSFSFIHRTAASLRRGFYLEIFLRPQGASSTSLREQENTQYGDKAQSDDSKKASKRHSQGMEWV
jgi:hypothetical protein